MPTIEIPFPREPGGKGDWTIAYYYLYGIKKALGAVPIRSLEDLELEDIECVLLALEQYINSIR